MNIQSGLFHDVSVWHTTHRFITDGAASRDLMACADAFQIAPLESPANRGTAIMQGAYYTKKRGIPIVRNVSLNVTYLACGRALFDVSPTIAACGLCSVLIATTAADVSGMYARGFRCFLDAVEVGDVLPVGGQLLNLSHGCTLSLTACAVSHIVGSRHPFQVVGSVVCLVFVDVVDGFEVLRIRNESICHKTMHQLHFGLALHLEQYAQIAAVNLLRCQHLAFGGSVGDCSPPRCVGDLLVK